MNVIVRVLFDKPAEEDWQAMRSLPTLCLA